MFSKILFKNASVLFIIIAILYVLGQTFYLNWTFWWYDVILHIISGGLIGIVAVFLWSRSYNASYKQKVKIIIFSLASALVIGVLWEVYEIKFHMVSLEDLEFYKKDTISDLIADASGAFFGALYSFKKLSRN